MDRDKFKRRAFKYSYFTLLIVFAHCMYKSHQYGYFEIERAVYGTIGYSAVAVIGFVMSMFPEFSVRAAKKGGSQPAGEKVTMARRTGMLILMVCAVQITSRWV